MTTARDIVTLASKQAGVLGVGQTLLAEDVSDIFTLLSQMLSQWQIRRWLVPALMDISMPGNNAVSNTVGIGGYWNIPRPNDIKGAYIVQLNTGTTPVSLQCRKIFSYEEYIEISVKELNSLPDHFFYDAQWAGGLGNLFFWPVPNPTYETHILVEAQLNFPLAVTNPPTNGTGLDTVFSLPPEYLEAILYNLSLRISAMYQMEPTDQVVKLAKVALNSIRVNNTQIPKLKMPAALRKGKAFNIFNADSY